MKAKILLLIIIISSSVYSQGFEPPVPNTNIDSLISSTNFYEIMARAHLEIAVRISIKIDTAGTIEKIDYSPMFKESFSKQDSSFLKSINYKLAKISWQPAKYNLQKVNSVFTVPFVMFFKNSRKYLDIYYGKKRGSYNSRYSSNMGNADYSDPIIKVRDAGILESSMIR